MPRKKRGGIMKGRFTASTDPDLTPLINCMFLLLVFFMVATTFVNSKGLSVDLPGGQGESRASKDMNVVIEADGQIQVNGQTAARDQLADRIGTLMEQDNTTNMILECDRSVPHSKVIEVMDIARGQGIEGIAFAKRAQTGG